MRTAQFLRQPLPKYQIRCTRSSSQIFVILIWPRGKNTTYTENSCTAHNFYEMLSCQLLPLETYICMLNMLVMERFLFACFVCCCFFCMCNVGELFPFARVYLQDCYRYLQIYYISFGLFGVARPTVDYICLENNTYLVHLD